MTDTSIKISADNMRADFLDANTTWERWKILNRALEWATAASENADQLRRDRGRQYFIHGERILASDTHEIRAGDVVTWGGEEEGWIVRRVVDAAHVEIIPLGVNWNLGAQIITARALLGDDDD